MKVVHIALKDLTRSFRSTFAVVFMFGVPLLVAGMFYFMFGNIASQGNEFDLPITRLAIANLDEGSQSLPKGFVLFGSGAGAEINNLGEVISKTLQNETLSKLVKVDVLSDEKAVKEAVDQKTADVALIIPAGFSEGFFSQAALSTSVSVELYANPEKSIELAVVKSILDQFLELMSGAKITATIAANHTMDPAVVEKVVQEYLSNTGQFSRESSSLIAVQPVTKQAQPNRILAIVGPIMVGMMIFYAFYTGMTTAESILREDEEGTLPRLFTTPTSRTVILGGKFLAVGLTVLVQVVVLIIVSRLIFQIQWGQTGAVALLTLGTVLAASSFGIFANSLIKSTKQGGVIYGGVLTVTGMLGMMRIFTLSSPNVSPAMQIVSLLVPQGWSVNGFLQSASAAPVQDILLTFFGLLVWSVVFFAIGAWRFQKRFA